MRWFHHRRRPKTTVAQRAQTLGLLNGAPVRIPIKFAILTPMKESPMLDLEALETRLKHVEGTVYSFLEREAHTKIGEVLTTAAKAIVAVLPEGSEAEQIVSQLVNVADQAHNVLHAAAGAVDPLAQEVAAAATQPADAPA